MNESIEQNNITNSINQQTEQKETKPTINKKYLVHGVALQCLITILMIVPMFKCEVVSEEGFLKGIDYYSYIDPILGIIFLIPAIINLILMIKNLIQQLKYSNIKLMGIGWNIILYIISIHGLELIVISMSIADYAINESSLWPHFSILPTLYIFIASLILYIVYLVRYSIMKKRIINK